MYEHRSQPLAHPKIFFRRVIRNTLLGLLMIGGSLFAGMLGYHHLVGLSWVDAYMNASMILSGMGPVATIESDAGKVFAGTYALFSGLVLIAVAGIALAPVVHRAFHRFHLELRD